MAGEIGWTVHEKSFIEGEIGNVESEEYGVVDEEQGGVGYRNTHN